MYHAGRGLAGAGVVRPWAWRWGKVSVGDGGLSCGRAAWWCGGSLVGARRLRSAVAWAKLEATLACLGQAQSQALGWRGFRIAQSSAL